MWDPETIALLQHAARTTTTGRPGSLRGFADAVNDENAPKRHAPRPARASHGPPSAVPLDEVEPATEIVKRFSTGA